MRKIEEKPKGIAVSLAKALDRHFVACAATATVAAVAGYTEQSKGAIVYSGPENLNVGFGGPGQLYINLVTKAEASGNNPVAGWDINPFIRASDGIFFMYTPVKNELVQSSAATPPTADVAKLASGTGVSSSSTFVNYTGGFMNSNGAGDWTGAGTGYMGFKISHAGVNGGSPVFGWVQISKANAGSPTGDPTGINIIDWAYQDNGSAIAAGDTGVPEPSALALLAAGALDLLARRGRARLSAA